MPEQSFDFFSYLSVYVKKYINANHAPDIPCLPCVHLCFSCAQFIPASSTHSLIHQFICSPFIDLHTNV